MGESCKFLCLSTINFKAGIFFSIKAIVSLHLRYPTTVNVYATIAFVAFDNCHCLPNNCLCIAQQQSMFTQQLILYRLTIASV
jgi:hypothetical protein